MFKAQPKTAPTQAWPVGVLLRLANMDKFLYTRPGLSELIAIRQDTSGPQGKNGKGISLEINAGFYSSKPMHEKSFSEWKRLYVKSMIDSDSIFMIRAHHTYNSFSSLLSNIGVKHKNIKPYEIDPLFYIKLLEDLTSQQNVLIIFPFEESFEKNIKKLNSIYPKHNINTERLRVLKTPQTNFPPYPHDNWLETYSSLKDKISKINFDTALLSCGCYGHPLCSYIHSELDKSAYYIGGRLQLCFGILGSRWLNRPEVKPLINKNWTFPLKSETPSNFHKIENGCYWK